MCAGIAHAPKLYRFEGMSYEFKLYVMKFTNV